MAVVATLSKGYDLDYIWKQVDRGPAKDGASYYIHLFLEDTRRAQALLEAAATAHRDHSKPQAIVLGNLALALIRQGDPDEAAGRLHQAIDVIEVNRSGGGLNIVFTAAREMRPWRSLPTVQEVSDRLLTPHGGLSDHEGMTADSQAKQAIRERVWSQLERAGMAEPGVRGYIPAFDGAAQAAGRPAALQAWQQAQVLEVAPDRARLPVRIRALHDGKLLYMAAPKLAAGEPFYLLDPRTLPVSATDAADRTVGVRIAPGISISQMHAIDLIVCGSVAVNEHGARLGKGAGYPDIEAVLLAEAGLVTQQTIIATTVHDLQVLDEDLPEQPHDFRVDLIVTPERTIWPGHPKRPEKLDLDSLSPDQIAAMSVLAQRLRR